jgi:Na+:H+ antiporter, NhaA family
VAAVGGMLIPALFHLSFNFGTTAQPGIGIPMATDIAFALGVLALLGDRVPPALKVFLAALAIIDDLGAVIIIALFYTRDFSFMYFGFSLMLFSLLLVLNRLRVTRLIYYLLPGIVMWYFMLKSGVHATVAGILLAFAIPFFQDKKICPSYKLQHFLHKPVAFFVLPVFALANTGIVFNPGWHLTFTESNALGIITGLLFGKPLGIVIFALLAVKTKLCRLPEDMTFRHLAGLGALAGIGFTMAIFIANLAFANPELITSSKIAILAASVIAGAAGFFLLSTAPGSNSKHGLKVQAATPPANTS